MSIPNGPKTSGNTPLFALGSAVVLVGIICFTLATVNLDSSSTPIMLSIVGLVITTVPSLIAAAFAERSSRDIRNGVMVEKVRQGTHSALEESGVKTAVAAGNETTPAAITALALLVSEMAKLKDTGITIPVPVNDMSQVTTHDESVSPDAN